MSADTPRQLLGGPWQICFVVPHLESAIDTWVERYGIGPWSVWNLGPHNMVDLAIGERPAPYGMRIAMTQWDSMQIELIEPVDEHSIYAESLRAHGGRPHVHHLHCTAADYDSTLDRIRRRGQHALMSGGFRGARFSYLSTEDDIGTILEIGATPEDWTFPPPDSTYPA